MEKGLNEVERRVIQAWKDMVPLAAQYHYDLPPTPRVTGGRPTVILLGNHSSGKSTFINHLLGFDLQKTGIAPVDDGFTLIVKGPRGEESHGPPVLSRPEFPFPEMERLGPGFLSKLRMKFHDSETLDRVTLIDSPGMIDSSETSLARGYDFMAAVRSFAENVDLILFFFDPEKPGTTGETVAVFTQALSGFEHKMLILLNKVDTFESMRDFSRAYGALCWNLARVVRTKDLPHVYTLYVPEQAASRQGRIPLEDFDRARDEVVSETLNASNRRADNLLGNLKEHAARLDMHARVCSRFRGEMILADIHRWAAPAILIVLGAAMAWFFGRTSRWSSAAVAFGTGALLAGAAWLLGRLLRARYCASLLDGLDAIFENLYARDLTIADRHDLTARWQALKPRIHGLLHRLGARVIPMRPLRWNRRYQRLLRLLDREIPHLRKAMDSD